MNSNTYLTSYQRMEGIDFDEELDPDTLIHVVPKSDKTRWNHIEDLDNFFNRIYEYHQDGGFWCMVAKEVGKILSIIFTIVFSVFLYTDVDYQMLFKNKLPPDYDETKKIKLSDCIRSTQEAREYFDPFLCVCISLSIAFLIYKFVWLYVNLRRFKIMKRFYNEALGVEEHNIENVTWEEVQRRLMEVQVEQRMCIHKESLTELDIYHRILRYENYFIAMVNKNVIPLKLKLPILGEIVFLPRTLRFLLNGILFNFPLVAAFKKWQLKEEYKRTENRHELAESLRKKFFWVGVISLIFSPFVLLMQVLHSVYHYTAFVKTDPSILGIRVWSNYGKVSLRHYNELDHELRARLSRGYRFAGQYMNSFSSPLVANVAAPFSYITGAIAAVTIILALIDEDVLQVEHVFTIFTAMLGATALLRSFVPSENLVWCPEVLMTKILSEVHYLPDSWKGRAHTSRVRKEFSNYFQYTFSHLIESLFSPIVTPFILMFNMREKSLEIVDFFRHFTVEVPGVGDICSFALMDIGKHGSHTWHPAKPNVESTRSEYSPPNVTDHGKTELSLLHFTLTNPNWKPPQESVAFLHAVKEQACEDFGGLPPVRETGLYNSLISGSVVETGGAASLWLRNPMAQSICKSASHIEGPLGGKTNGIVGSLSRVNENVEGKGPIIHGLLPMDYDRNLLERPQDMVAYDMSISTLYLHQIHQRRRAANNYLDNLEGGAAPVYQDCSSSAVGSGMNRELYPPQSNFPESYYNSSDPPSVDDSIGASQSIFPNFAPPQRNNDETPQREVNLNTPFVHTPKT